MIKPFDKHAPEVPDGAFVAESAVLIGNVTIGEGSSVWYGAVLRGDHGAIRIGRNTNVQDNCVVHADPGGRVRIGDNVTVGHAAVIHGCVIGDNVLVGMNATILNDAKVGSNCVIGAGALVTQSREIPEGSLVMGVPAKVVRELTDEEIESVRKSAEEYSLLCARYSSIP